MKQQEFFQLINNAIDIFSNASSNDPYCLKRYEKITFFLNEMSKAIMSESYPRNYTVLPLCHYIERHMDSDEMYYAIKKLDEWYAKNYYQTHAN